MRRLCGVHLSSGIATVFCCAVTRADVVAFEHANVIPMDREVVLENHTVVIDDGVIVAMGPSELVNVPAGAQRIAAHDHFLMPGLADMHVHALGESDFHLLIANGVTFVRNMWGSELQSSWVERSNAGDPNVPVFYTVGTLVDGDPPIWDGSAVVTDAASARQHVIDQHDAGFDSIKVYNRLTRESYDTIVEMAAELGLDVVGHVPDDVGLRDVLQARQRTIEHLNGYIRACVGPEWDEELSGKLDYVQRALYGASCMDDDRLAEFVEATRAAGTWNCVTLIVLDKMCADRETEIARPTMDYVGPSLMQFWESATDSRQIGDEQRTTYRAAIRRITRALHEAGCPILLGSDFPNPWVVPGFSIHTELENLVECGLTPYEALFAGTVEAARYMRMEGTFGTVQVGRRADLLLLEANPLDDIRHSRSIAGVMLRGQWEDAEALAARLEEVRSAIEESGDTSNIFADAEPLPRPSEPSVESTCEISLGELTIGGERYGYFPQPDGSTRVLVQMVYLPPYKTLLLLDQLIDRAGVIRAISLTGEMTGRAIELQATRDGNRMHVKGQFGPQQIDETHDVDPSGSIAALGYAVEAFRLHALRASGDTHSENQVVVSYFPSFAVIPSTVRTTLMDDDALPDGHVRFNVETVMFGTTTPSTIEIGPSGELVSMDMQNPMGRFVVRQVEDN